MCTKRIHRPQQYTFRHSMTKSHLIIFYIRTFAFISTRTKRQINDCKSFYIFIMVNVSINLSWSINTTNINSTYTKQYSYSFQEIKWRKSRDEMRDYSKKPKRRRKKNYLADSQWRRASLIRGGDTGNGTEIRAHYQMRLAVLREHWCNDAYNDDSRQEYIEDICTWSTEIVPRVSDRWANARLCAITVYVHDDDDDEESRHSTRRGRKNTGLTLVYTAPPPGSTRIRGVHHVSTTYVRIVAFYLGYVMLLISVKPSSAGAFVNSRDLIKMRFLL